MKNPTRTTTVQSGEFQFDGPLERVSIGASEVPDGVEVAEGGEAKNLVIARSDPALAASLVSAWIKDEIEFEWLGARRGDYKDRGKREAAVRAWHAEGEDAFLLVKITNDRPQPIAFANVQRPIGDERYVEIGRLVVYGPFRKKRFGALFVNHLANRILNRKSTDVPITVVARVAKSNDVAERMFRKTVLWPGERPPWHKPDERDADIPYNWWAAAGSIESRVASLLLTYRKAQSKTQEELASSAKITRPSLSQFESGKPGTLPSLRTLHALVKSLALAKEDRARVGLALVGMDLSDLFGSLDQELDTSHRYKSDYWILSSELAEASDTHILEESKRALREGYARYFFVPATTWDDVKVRVVDLLIENATHPEALPLRVYTAPHALCALKVAIKNVRKERLGAMVFDEVSIAAPEAARQESGEAPLLGERAREPVSKRAFLKRETADELVRAVYRTVTLLERRPDIEADGFRLRWPGKNA